MKKVLICSLFLFMVISIVAGEARPRLRRGQELHLIVLTDTIKKTVTKAIKRIQPTEHPKGPHMIMGKSAVWVLSNLNKPDGWSITGYAKVKIDKQFRRSRWKFGIVNGELEAGRNIYEPRLRGHWRPNWERGPNIKGVAIGFHFWKEF